MNASACAGMTLESDELKLCSFQAISVRFDNSQEWSNFGYQTRPREKSSDSRRRKPALWVETQVPVVAPVGTKVTCFLPNFSAFDPEYFLGKGHSTPVHLLTPQNYAAQYAAGKFTLPRDSSGIPRAMRPAGRSRLSSRRLAMRYLRCRDAPTGMRARSVTKNRPR